LRVQIFREKMPNVPLPPEPILTRWSTWLTAACYYADHFDSFKEIVLEFSQSTSEAVAKCQKVLKNETVRGRVQETFATITPEMVTHSKRSLLRRARLCLQMNGGHF
jgi:hypothetical protein